MQTDSDKWRDKMEREVGAEKGTQGKKLLDRLPKAGEGQVQK